MKKLFGLLFVLAVGLAATARTTKVTTAAELQSAWSALSGTPDGDDSIIVAPGTYNVGTKLAFPKAGKIHVVGEYAELDSLPIILMEMTLTDSVPEGSKLSMFWENVNLQYRSGKSATSGQIFYIKKAYCSIDSLVIRNCVIDNFARTLYRCEPPGTKPDFRYGGDINYLELSGCRVHDGNIVSGNNWPLLYTGQVPLELVVRDNLFYNLPYSKSIINLTYLNFETGRNAKFYFEQNTVTVASANFNNSLINTGTCLGEETEYHINDNIFLFPNWTDDLNQPCATAKILSSKNGLVTAHNNLVEGYQSWRAGEATDDEGNPTWLELDTVPTYTMESLGVTWEMFTDAKNGDYTYLSTAPLATAGTEGQPIGARWLVLNMSQPVNFTAVTTIEGVEPTPAKATYEKGDEVTVEAPVVEGWKFLHWTNEAGVVLSTEAVYTFAIQADMTVTAVYEQRVVATVNFSVGSNSATISISPMQENYYVGDVITLTVDLHGLNEFTVWSDGNTEQTRQVTLTGDLNLKAIVEESYYIMAWDFCQITKNNQKFNSGLEPNHSDRAVSLSNTLGYLSMAFYDGETYRDTTEFQTRNNKMGNHIINCALRRSTKENFDTHPDYLYFSFHTLPLTTNGAGAVNWYKVSAMVGTDNKCHKTQLLQYSVSGEDYITFGKVDIDSVGAWFKLEGELPREVWTGLDSSDSITIRIIGDVTGEKLLGPSSTDEYEFGFTGDIKVLYEPDMSGIHEATGDELRPTFTLNDGMVQIQGAAQESVTLYSMDGKLLRNYPKGSYSVQLPQRGSYLLKVGNTHFKLMY